jgi:hypothetical protein
MGQHRRAWEVVMAEDFQDEHRETGRAAIQSVPIPEGPQRQSGRAR